MSCIINNGVAVECRDNMGGIQSVYIANAIEGFNFFPAAGNVPIITFNPANENTFYEFQQQIESASYEETVMQNIENATYYYEQKLTIKIYDIAATSTDIVNQLGKGLYNIIFLDKNGLYFLPGAFNQMRVSEANTSSGKMFGDMSGSTIVFTGKEKKSAFQVSTAAAQYVIVDPLEPTPIAQLIGTIPPYTLSLSGVNSDILYDGIYGGTWSVDNANISTIVFPVAPARLGIFGVSIGTSSVSYTLGGTTVSEIIYIVA